MAYHTIVLEGCDGVGKTVIAQQIAEEYGFTAVHSTLTPESISIFGRYMNLLGRGGKLVLDRAFISEPVYGQIFRGTSRLTSAEVVELSKAVAARNGVLIHLTASARCIAQRLQARDGHGAWGVPMIELVQAGYEQVFAQLAGYVTVIRHATDGS